jgi:hypothetical protein
LLKLYSPAEQSLQKVLSALDSLPVAQAVQLDEAVAVLYCPAGHREHDAGKGAPSILEYFPIAQGRHNNDELLK